MQHARFSTRAWWITVLVVAVSLSSVAARADSAADAVAQIERLHDALVEIASIEPDPGLDQRYLQLAPVVAGTHDFDRMARFAAGRAARSWDEQQSAAFRELFERLSITTYASRFASIGADNFEIVGSEMSADDEIEVSALIHRPEGEPVTLDYQLESADGQWRIVMVRNDGVSELAMMRAEYSDILAEGSFEDLLAELEAQIAAL